MAAVIKLYLSTVGCNQMMKKHQQHIIDILTSRKITFETIDIADPNNEEDKKFMRENAQSPTGKTPMPPQLFSGDAYLGDYEQFAEAIETDEIDVFLKLATKTEVSQAQVELSGGKDD